jgi:hydrogenase expression/formation protein HypE
MAALGDRLAFTTDSYVVQPLDFPGGNIGKLAICGTVNDLAVGGAIPLYLSCSVIIEEGLPVETMRMVARTMAATAAEAGVKVVTGRYQRLSNAEPVTSCSSTLPVWV